MSSRGELAKLSLIQGALMRIEYDCMLNQYILHVKAQFDAWCLFLHAHHKALHLDRVYSLCRAMRCPIVFFLLSTTTR